MIPRTLLASSTKHGEAYRASQREDTYELLSKQMSFLILAIRQSIHSLTGSGTSCRFIPCCSGYAREAFEKAPFLRAVWLVLTRLVRCRPGSSSGGFDPVSIKGASDGF